MSDLKTYWQELATKANVPADRAKAVLEALGDESVAKVFAEGFVARPDYSRDLDKTRDEWKGKHDSAAAEAKKWKDWYESDAKPAYEANKAGIAKLQKYYEIYGELPADGELRKPNSADTYSRKEIEELLSKEVNGVKTQAVQLLKFIPKKAIEYERKFGKLPDLDEFEKFALEKGLPVEAAWDQWTSPLVREKENAEWEAKLKAAREEGFKDGQSRSKLPTNGSKREGGNHVFFDRKDPKEIKEPNAGRKAFLETLNDPNYKER